MDFQDRVILNQIVSSSVNSDFALIQRHSIYAIQFSFGAIIGTAYIQESNDNVSYIDALDGAGNNISSPISGPGNGMITVSDSGAEYVRVRYAHTSGADYLIIRSNVKG